MTPILGEMQLARLYWKAVLIPEPHANTEIQDKNCIFQLHCSFQNNDGFVEGSVAMQS